MKPTNLNQLRQSFKGIKLQNLLLWKIQRKHDTGKLESGFARIMKVKKQSSLLKRHKHVKKKKKKKKKQHLTFNGSILCVNNVAT